MAPAACVEVETVAEIVLPRLAENRYSAKDQAEACLSPPSQRVEHIEGFYDCLHEVHPWHRPAMPSHEKLQQSPHYPVLVTPNPMAKEQEVNGVMDPAQELPINGSAMPIRTPLFEGRLEVHLKGLPSSQPRMFDGKKRFFHVMCQGRFKRPVDADGLCMGQEFVKAGGVPPWVGEVVLTAAAKVFSSSTQVDITAKLPYFMNPMLAACQLVNVAQPGSEPPLAEAQEDMRLFAPALSDRQGAPLSPEKRRKWCDVPKNLHGLKFSPDYVYTFHLWQHVVDFSTYKLSVGGFVNLDMTHALNCQPLQLTCKDTHADEYVFSLLVWHERLLYGDDTSAAAAAAAALAERIAKWGTGLKNFWGSSSSSSNSSSASGSDKSSSSSSTSCRDDAGRGDK